MPEKERSGFRGQVVRFVASGIVATLIDLIVLNLLIRLFPDAREVLGLPAYLAWKTVSFSTASVYSYFANKYFTFRASQASTPGEVSKFALVALAGFCINVLVPAGLFNFFSRVGFLSPVLRANAASVMGTAVSLVVNFLGYKLFVFMK